MTIAADGVGIRPAVPDDIGLLEALIAASARGLSGGFYARAQTEAAIAHVFGVDSMLVADGSYYVAETDGVPVGCGGWSARQTLFGGDRYAGRRDDALDPATQPARIRAFFVAPGHARRGIASALLETSETAAAAAGFKRAALMATLPGVPFYRAHRYRPGDETVLDLAGTAVRFLAMEKSLLQICDRLKELSC